MTKSGLTMGGQGLRAWSGLAGLRLILLFLALALLGCGKPPVLVKKYIWEYPSPAFGGLAPLHEAIKVEQFGVAQAFDSPAMVYRPTLYQSEVYNYHRWRVNPGYLVTDYLLRDLRNSKLFKAVFSGDDLGKGRFVLEGGVEEIQEVDGQGGWVAALALNVTLLDTSQKEVTKRVVFQRNYRAMEPMTEQTPRGLAEGMSRAMAKLSAQIIADTYRAAQGAVKSGEGSK